MTEVEDQERSTKLDVEDVHHGAHVECQRGAPFVQMVCGLIDDWEGQTFETTKPRCPICWNADFCPLCGARVR